MGCLSVEDYRCYVLPHVTKLVKRLQKAEVPIIYFGTDSATLLPSMKETGAEVIGLDWRIPLDAGWQSLGLRGSVQGNLDPVLLFADWKLRRARRRDPRRAADALVTSSISVTVFFLKPRWTRESALRFRPKALSEFKK